MILIALSLLLTISVIGNILAVLFLKKKPPKQNSRTAEELLHDILAGDAIVRIQRIAPADVLLRSPR